MKKYLFGVLICLIGWTSSAQTDSTKHYFSIQANQLIRQLLNFGGSSPAVNNPYLLTYSFEKQNGVGVSIGLGLEADNFEDGDAFSQRETSFTDFSMRIGFDKKSLLGKKFLLGVGLDLLFQANNNETTSTFNFNNGNFSTNETTVITTNVSKGFGFGPRLNLSYELTQNILIGTEASYYFKSINTSSESENDDNPSSDFSEEFTNTSFKMVLPSVLYLTFRF
ncbi:MAG: hypothetical protein JXR10_13905 [Cyclobacteriaceae bacterium]